jgi:hypothetical protein
MTTSEPQLYRTIKVLIEKGDKAKEKANQFYTAAGQHLKTLRAAHKDRGGSWVEWEALVKEKCGIGKSRASELMQIADGTKTVNGVRDRAAESMRQSRAQISPQRCGESQRRESLPAGELAEYPPEIEDGYDDGQTVWRRRLIFRAKSAAAGATFEDWPGFEMDCEVVQAVEQAADAWNKLIAYLKGIPSTEPTPDEDGGIPEFLRRTRAGDAA